MVSIGSNGILPSEVAWSEGSRPRDPISMQIRRPITRGRKISEKIAALVVSSTRKATVDELDSDYIRYGDGRFIFKDTLEDMIVHSQTTTYIQSNLFCFGIIYLFQGIHLALVTF